MLFTEILLSQHVTKLLGNRQSKPRTAIAAGGHSIGQHTGIKDTGFYLLGHANVGVLRHFCDPVLVFYKVPVNGGNSNSAVLREFAGIMDQVVAVPGATWSDCYASLAGSAVY